MAVRRDIQQKLDAFRAELREFGSTELSRAELILQVQEQYDAAKKRLGYAPIVVLNNKSENLPGVVDVVKMKRGIEVLYVSPHSRRWTRQDVLDQFTSDEDAKLWPVLKDGVYFGRLEQLARRAGMQTPTLYLNPNRNANGAAGMTKEGNVYIRLSMSVPDDELDGTLAHELGHINLGHTTIENRLAAHNDLRIAKRFEYEADQFARTICAADGLLVAFKQDQRQFRAMAKEEGVSVASVEARDTVHPPMTARIARLEAGLKQDAGKCSAPTSPLKVPDVRPVSTEKGVR